MSIGDSILAGVIGLGVGERHIANYLAHPNCQVTWLCDKNPQKLAEVGKRFPQCKLTTNPNDILDSQDLGVVSVASFDDVHFEQVIRGIRNGKHIMVEKPMCQTRSHAELIREELQKNPSVQLSSNHPLRNSSRFRELKKNIANGDFGKVYFAEGDYQYGRLEKLTRGWRGKLDFYSVVQGGAVHMIDLLLWMLDDEVAEVVSMGNKLVTENEDFRFDDHVIAVLRLESGRLAKVTGNFSCVRPHFHAVQIFGDRKTFINQAGDAQLYTSTEGDAVPEDVTTPYRDYHKPDLFTSFIDSILGRGTPLVSTEDVFRAMGVCFSIEEALTARRIIPNRKI